MVREREAIRVGEWVKEAVSSGAHLVTGGRRQGVIYEPTIVADVKPEMRISCDELFGPAVAVTTFIDIDEAIALANDSNYGLAAGIFTENRRGRGSSRARCIPATSTASRSPASGPSPPPPDGVTASGSTAAQGRRLRSPV